MMPQFLSLYLFLFSLILASSTPAAASTTFSVVDLTNYHQIELPKGPESVAFDCSGEGPYVGVSDGRILKWQGPYWGWTDFAFTSPTRQRKICDGSTDNTTEPMCGRPLGLKFHPKTCELYIADAYFGLLKIGINGGHPQQLATSLDGVPFRFLNALDIDSQTGTVYLSDTSTVYQRRLWPLSVATGDKTGRVLQYDPSTEKMTVLLNNLAFANGVALSKDSSFLLVAESVTAKIFKLWLRGSKAGDVQLFTQLRRPADNIKRTKNGEFWVAVNSLRALQYNQTSAFWLTKDPVGVKFDEQGNVVEVLDGEGGPTLESISEVEEHNGNLWIGSVVKPYVGVIRPYIDNPDYLLEMLYAAINYSLRGNKLQCLLRALKWSPLGGHPQQLATSVNGVPFRFLNALDIDIQSGIVYFTESSTVYQRRFSALSIATGDKTGRVLKYDPRKKNVTVLLNNLTFANGVALSKDSSFLLVVETVTFKIFKLWLRGPKAGNVQLFSQLKRQADNIKRTDNGEFWVGVLRNSQGNKTFSDLWLTKDPVGVKFDEQANVVEVLDGG